jgi:hypothetical protein
MNEMHGVDNFKIVLVQKISCVNNCRSTKVKLLKVNATIGLINKV